MDHCYECGADLLPGEGSVVDVEFWVFPASGAPEGAEEVRETRPTLLCAACAAIETT
jgi:hypothetical protein